MEKFQIIKMVNLAELKKPAKEYYFPHFKKTYFFKHIHD